MKIGENVKPMPFYSQSSIAWLMPPEKNDNENEDYELSAKKQVLDAYIKSVDTMSAGMFTQKSWSSFVQSYKLALSASKLKNALLVDINRAISQMQMALVKLEYAHRDDKIGNQNEKTSVDHAQSIKDLLGQTKAAAINSQGAQATSEFTSEPATASATVSIEESSNA